MCTQLVRLHHKRFNSRIFQFYVPRLCFWRKLPATSEKLSCNILMLSSLININICRELQKIGILNNILQCKIYTVLCSLVTLIKSVQTTENESDDDRNELENCSLARSLFLLHVPLIKRATLIRFIGKSDNLRGNTEQKWSYRISCLVKALQ